ncbi:ACT domain-containing protein [Chitinophaga sp. Cy-1792]|uniref:ACT domain-containing protein n=1 Tax=Chitinophaga sp. Cy-1792 TaxID=2608339 RepID=UPI00141F5929|nr:ACT domain-containing protein [Chitinophaga sp. Cy-1792]NIG55436.1 ACT domain-containing protein [Chitinophaga sp. Cy-1792]
MTGENNLRHLLKHMKPELNKGTYVFCTMPGIEQLDISQAVFVFREKEGWTVVLEQPYAKMLGLEYTFVAAWITLTVHSSLEAVGLTAAFSQALSGNGISCNVVAAYHHDHIFVPAADAAKAMAVLAALSEQN